MDAVVVLHGRLRPPNFGGLFFSLVRSDGGARVVAHPLPTYHRCVSEERSFVYLVSPLLVVVGILGLFSLSRALSIRPEANARTLRLLALCRGGGRSYCVLVPCAQLLARSRLVLGPCGLCWALLDGVSHPSEV